MSEADPAAAAVAEEDAEAFLGLPFSRLGLATATAAVCHAAQGTNWRYVVTPNAAHLARLDGRDPVLLRIYTQAAFCFLDSRVIALAARAVGRRPPPVVPGSDLVARLFAEAIGPDTPLCVIGGTPEAVTAVRLRFGLRQVEHMNPPFGFWRDPEELTRVATFVVTSQADYSFLCVGSPQQEILADRIRALGGARGVGLCVGASLDFLTGAQKRAPRLVRRLALEWAYRFAQEPRRLARRYMVESPRGVMLLLRPGR